MKHQEKPRDYDAQYVDIKINKRHARDMFGTGEEANIMINTEATRLELTYVQITPNLR